MEATAFAHTNIALIKYWGKRQQKFNLPDTDSLSLTLKAFGTETTVTLHEGDTDRFILNKEEQDANSLKKVSAFLDLIRSKSTTEQKAIVQSTNHVPTAAGLASSASAFAALALAASKVYGLENQSQKALSILARQGSGSAARSIYGGFVHMKKGQAEDGHDAYAVPIEEHQLNLSMLVIPCDTRPKKVSSTIGMNHTQATSPYYDIWVQSHDEDIQAAHKAIAANDFDDLGHIMEHSTLKMHATALTAQPGLWYWNAKTWEALCAVKELRSASLPFYFTMDAGPHVKVLVQREQREEIKKLLAKNLNRSQDAIWTSDVGGPAFLMGTHHDGV